MIDWLEVGVALVEVDSLVILIVDRGEWRQRAG